MKKFLFITLAFCMSEGNADMNKIDETNKAQNLWFMLSKPAIHPKDIAALQKALNIKKDKTDKTDSKKDEPPK